MFEIFLYLNFKDLLHDDGLDIVICQAIRIIAICIFSDLLRDEGVECAICQKTRVITFMYIFRPAAR